jgi:hypothetical protein
MSAKEAEVTGEKKEALFICELCGPEKPVEKVFQCTVCLKDFCVPHLGTWQHDCYQNE